MRGTRLIDLIEQVTLLISEANDQGVHEWLAINQQAEKCLGISREDLDTLTPITVTEQPLTEGEDRELTLTVGQAPIALHLQAHRDTFDGQSCWVLVGSVVSAPPSPQPWDSLFPEGTAQLIEALSDAFILTAPDFTILKWNQAAEDLYGWKAEEVAGQNMGEVVPTTYEHTTSEEVIKQFLETGSWAGDVRQQTRSGETKYVYAAVNFLYNEHRQPIGVIALNRDISARKEMELTLQKRELQLSLASQVAYDFLYEWNPTTQEIAFFDDVDELFGYPLGTFPTPLRADEAGLALWYSLIHPEDLLLMQAAVQHATHNTESYEYTYRFMHADGRYRTLWDRGLPILDEQGMVQKWIGVCLDITSQKEVENRQRERDKLLRTVAENFPRAYLSVINADMTVGFTNGQEFKLQNLDPTQFEGLHIKDVFGAYGPEVVETITRAYQRTFEGEEQHFELNIGAEYQDYRTVPIVDEQGAVNQILAVVRNITEDKLKEIQIRESEEKFSKAFYLHPVPMAIFQIYDGTRIEVNDSYLALFGYERHEILGRTHVDLNLEISPETQIQIQQSLRREGVIQGLPLNMRTRHGKKLDLLVNAAMLDVADGNWAIFSVLDVTQRKQIEDSLRRSEAHLRSLVQTIPDMVWLKDLDGHYLACNPKFSQLYGGKVRDILGKTDFDFLPHSEAQQVRQSDQEVLQNGQPQIQEEDLHFAETGHTTLIETIKTPMYDPSGMLIGVLGIGRDITERVQNLQAIQAQNRQLQEIAWMQSHTVREPLAKIMALVSLLEFSETTDLAQQQMIASEIVSSARELDGIIHQIVNKAHLYSELFEQPM